MSGERAGTAEVLDRDPPRGENVVKSLALRVFSSATTLTLLVAVVEAGRKWS